MKQNTEQLNKIEELQKQFDKKFQTFDWHTRVYIWDFFSPHLISSDEIKREALEGFVKWLQTDSEQLDENGYPLVYGLDDKDGDFLMIKEMVKDYLSYLTQSKEGGE